jgi:hypothetical protein
VAQRIEGDRCHRDLAFLIAFATADDNGGEAVRRRSPDRPGRSVAKATVTFEHNEDRQRRRDDRNPFAAAQSIIVSYAYRLNVSKNEEGIRTPSVAVVRNIALRIFGRYSAKGHRFWTGIPPMPHPFAYVRVAITGQTTKNQIQEIEAARLQGGSPPVVCKTVPGSSAIAWHRC